MPLREKAKSLFRTRSKTDRDSLSKTSTSDSSRERWPSNVYKPGETMPKPKYRATPKKEHTEKLQSFSFSDSWRKRSFQSQHSPMGTRLPSRRNSSRAPSRKNSIFSLGGRRSTSDAGRTNSVTSVETGGSEMKKRKKDVAHAQHAAKPTTLSTELEGEEEGDVRNVGLARAGSRHRPRSREHAAATIAPVSGPIPPMSTAHDHQPFTEHDLALALKRSHLAVPAN